MKTIKLFLFFLILFLLSGCCGPQEAVRGFLGKSTKVLEDKRKDAIARDFNLDFDAARGRIKAALKKEGSHIYREDLSLNLIAVYISETDTTPVGIFLTALDIDNTRVEISSPSIYGKEVIAKNIFQALKGTLDEKKQ
ncbi:MAG: hypothetical protein PHP89_05775 [Candidatus Omnitrophica bacterium]|jgi:hypothetical protein|nr:hypothetical protein [Candidatus Omnitrophota bacterium]MDD3988168.1 hypothetical protein [Candidatus Omnitrophota bacterium]MDD4981785.1 hypothetical protein [Candidatus Omnitrophota bacterium]MDD5665186.1 hypothetical protein [Candidatus Omnitrophota bacterium]